ncbi:YlmC/YmxH family sporulation protein [Mechercharimyces sp. CAU 1602]|uniref:YlmC/YmxH family sporulation protein n=1 Tax=Mechercharimyces sp. CAU 1602 TaxID=2973933 RepID=UPI0021614477|nr:YlmC/YmxH family sporulation protein [Mechercharimyces sp. CAU 1602]MCS1351261.1 YlmC/YmxH family sporulation protein [Mechercharimyces sp. CAU 1602]
MRWSELAEKEVIDLSGGERLGVIGKSDMVINRESGTIQSFIMPIGSSWLGKRQGEYEIAWNMVKKVGPEMLIIESPRHFHR